jgi:hypothetical protein
MTADKTRDTKQDTVGTVRRQQHTGNHERSPGEDPDRFAGTRAGAENVEPVKKPRPTRSG